jgi:fatty acid desaturase
MPRYAADRRTVAYLAGTTFNNCYHNVHHLEPGVHWSQLRDLHQQHAH